MAAATTPGKELSTRCGGGERERVACSGQIRGGGWGAPRHAQGLLPRRAEKLSLWIAAGPPSPRGFGGGAFCAGGDCAQTWQWREAKPYMEGGRAGREGAVWKGGGGWKGPLGELAGWQAQPIAAAVL